MDLLSLLQAYAIMQGSHTGGHFDSASKIGVPISMNGITEENWGEPTETKTRPHYEPVKTGNGIFDKKYIQTGIEEYQSPNYRAKTDINGAGFQIQDEISSKVNNKETSLVNAFLKSLYLAGVPKIMNGNQGDIKEMQKSSGNRYVPHIVGATALSDVIGSMYPKRDWSLGFSTFGNGQPGVVFNKRF